MNLELCIESLTCHSGRLSFIGAYSQHLVRKLFSFIIFTSRKVPFFNSQATLLRTKKYKYVCMCMWMHAHACLIPCTGDMHSILIVWLIVNLAHCKSSSLSFQILVHFCLFFRGFCPWVFVILFRGNWEITPSCNLEVLKTKNSKIKMSKSAYCVHDGVPSV